jgi:hypothetical protein
MREAVLAVSALAIVALLTVVVYQNHRRFHKPLITTPYQAVTLVNGTVFYGRIEHLGSDHPVLRDAFSIRREADPQTRQSRDLLIKRKDEATGADHLIFPVAAIAIVEPVRPDSGVGRLIEQAGLPR